MNGRFLACCLLVLAVVPASGQRWQIGTDQRHIVWRPGSDLPHEDCVEMTGEATSLVLRLFQISQFHVRIIRKYTS